MKASNQDKPKGLALWDSLVALLIPGLSVDSVAGHLPPVGDVLSDLLRVAVPLTPLAVMLRCEAHGVLLLYRRGTVSHEAGAQTPAEGGGRGYRPAASAPAAWG